ncbi:MAG: ParB N-terminal domain-containing protein [Oribacterium sp.]|nr:ParB N-terminal domain-containing protein [Oribacterium sp.]
MTAKVQKKGWGDPIIVEKMYPDGYMILNGHHRWAAATRLGLKKVLSLT